MDIYGGMWNGGIANSAKMTQRPWPKGHIFLFTSSRISLAYNFTEVKGIDTCIVASL